jgi:hypothetical protein
MILTLSPEQLAALDPQAVQVNDQLNALALLTDALAQPRPTPPAGTEKRYLLIELPDADRIPKRTYKDKCPCRPGGLHK